MENKEAIAIIREMIQQRCQQDREFEALSVALDALTATPFAKEKIKHESERTRDMAYNLGSAWGVSHEQDKLYAIAEGLERAVKIIDGDCS